MKTLSRREILKLGALLPAIRFMPASASAPGLQSADRPNIIFIVLDTLTATQVSLYGYPRDTMPNLARLSERATVFHNHHANGIFTTPGTTSILTGTQPWTHRALHLNQTAHPFFTDNNIFKYFNDYHRIAYTHNPLVDTLLEQFGGHLDSHHTFDELYLGNSRWFWGLFDNDSDLASISWVRNIERDSLTNLPFLTQLNEFLNQRALETHLQNYPRGIPKASGGSFVMEDAIDWAIDILPELPQPFLFYFHLLPPHFPYTPRQEFIGHFRDDGYRPVVKPTHLFTEGYGPDILARWQNEYNEHVLYADHEFGRLYDYLVDSGLLDNSWLIFTSDHGEIFERGLWEHDGPIVYDALCRIPLLVSEPGQQSRADNYALTQEADLLPTLLHLFDREIPEVIEGQPIPPYGPPPTADQPMYILEARKSPPYKPLVKFTAGIRQGDYKLHYYQGWDGLVEPMIELYDIENDPDELTDLSLDLPQLAAEMQQRLLDDKYQAEERLRNQQQQE